MRLKLLALTSVACVSWSCAGSDAPSTGSADSTSSSTGDEDPSTSSETTSSSTSPTTTESQGESTPAESSSSEESSSTAAVDSSSSGEPCPAGMQGCPCDVGACDSDSVCVGDVCEALENCAVDGYEPNESEDAAVDLGTLGDGDDPGSIAATLDHEDDVDWFRYSGEDNFGLPPGVAPGRELSANGGLRMCKFFECSDGIAVVEFECPAESELAQSPAGRPGCCGMGTIQLDDFNCTGGTDDSAQVFIRLDNADAQCVDYTVGYEF